MWLINFILKRIDTWQQNHRPLAFSYAVVKRYGEDQAGYQAALLAYYGFLSLFPLLLVLTTVTEIVARRNPHLQDTIITSMTNYFPVLGNQLSSHIQGIGGSGIALAVGIILTLYGARGVADAFRHGVGMIWRVPQTKQPGFPKNILRSLSLIVIGGLGLLLASLAASITASAGRGFLFTLLPLAINIIIMFWLFSFLVNFSLPTKLSLRDTRAGAITAAVGLVTLQTLGSFLLRHELKNLDALYSNFAIPLSLLFWIYLQAQVLYYAVEVAAVHVSGEWPRSLSGKVLTKADKQIASRPQPEIIT